MVVLNLLWDMSLILIDYLLIKGHLILRHHHVGRVLLVLTIDLLIGVEHGAH
jgi:hypothetical protein